MRFRTYDFALVLAFFAGTFSLSGSVEAGRFLGSASGVGEAAVSAVAVAVTPLDAMAIVVGDNDRPNGSWSSNAGENPEKTCSFKRNQPRHLLDWSYLDKRLFFNANHTLC